MQRLLPALMLGCFVAMSGWSAEGTTPEAGKYGAISDLQQYLVADVLISQEAEDKNPTVKRFYLKNGRIEKLGKRDFLIGDGVVESQKLVVVPVDRIAFLGGLGNNQDFIKTQMPK